MNIAIIGAGHAGVEAAATARAAGAEQVTLFTSESTLPYFRPRLIAVACGQTAAGEIAMHDAAWYADRGITLCSATVERVDPATHSVVAGGKTQAFDGVAITCGANPFTIPLDGAQPDMAIRTLWNLDDALRLRERIANKHRLLVIGGGLLGVEAALRASMAGAVVAMVERLPRVMAAQLGELAAAALLSQLTASGVDVTCGCCVKSVAPDGNAIRVTLDNDRAFCVDTILFSMGARANLTLAKASGLSVNRGIVADDNLQAAPGIFVAGDVAEVNGVVRGSARDASAQGKLAGANLVAALKGLPLTPFAGSAPQTLMKVGRVEVHAAGAASAEGSVETRLDDASDPSILRVVVKKEDKLIGVQQLGTRKGFDELAAQL